VSVYTFAEFRKDWKLHNIEMSSSSDNFKWNIKQYWNITNVRCLIGATWYIVSFLDWGHLMNWTFQFEIVNGICLLGRPCQMSNDKRMPNCILIFNGFLIAVQVNFGRPSPPTNSRTRRQTVLFVLFYMYFFPGETHSSLASLLAPFS
jgi:hypothetical protein